MVEIYQFMCRTDNFGVLIRDAKSGVTAIVDAPEEDAILQAVEATGWTPSLLMITHHHGDHVAANLALKQRFGITIVGPAKEAEKIPGIDRTLREGDALLIGSERVMVIETPGHTAGHISYYLENSKILFSGDTLFALGCGRLLECGPEIMFNSLKKITDLPSETQIYCGHEYTLSNARFALTVDPDNEALKSRAKQVEEAVEQGQFTLPTLLKQERETNPFLRSADPSIRKNLGMTDASDEAVFAEIRRRKDSF